MGKILSFSSKKKEMEKDLKTIIEYRRLQRKQTHLMNSSRILEKGVREELRKGNETLAERLHQGWKRREREIATGKDAIESFRVTHRAALERVVKRRAERKQAKRTTPKKGFFRRLFRRRAA